MSKKNQKKFILCWNTPAVVLISVFAVIGLLVAFPPKWSWLGIGESQEISQETQEKINSKGKKTVTTIKHEQAKTLWDWLSLLGVPLSLLLLGAWLQSLQQQRAEEQKVLEQKQAEEQAKLEQKIATENWREEALQNYLDRVSELLIDKNVIATAVKLQDVINDQQGRLPAELRETTDKEVELVSAATNLIRARTLSILRRLGQDGERKGDVIRFLIEAEVINKLNLDLSNADLSNANLSRTKIIKAISKFILTNATLTEAKFQGANLVNADLDYSNLEKSDLTSIVIKNTLLRGADLSEAILNNANFIHVDLNETKLIKANLIGANFNDTYLTNASLNNADLSGANLSGVKNWTEAQLAEAKLCRTQLPEGCSLNSNRDCEELGISPTLPESTASE